MCLHVNFQSVQIYNKNHFIKLTNCAVSSEDVNLFTFQTDSYEDVVFVSEKSAPKPIKITVDQVKLLALQRDIDEQSRPTQRAKPLISLRFLVNEPAETKMEGGNGEENIPTKEKKHKKGKIFSPEIQNCSDEDGSQAKMKKEKKWKKVETEAKYKEDEGDQKKEKKKTKKKKHVSISLTIGIDEDDQMKKKKLVEHNVIKEEHVTLNDESLEKKKRKKKLKDKSLLIKPGNIKKEEAEEMQIVNNNPSKKPKKEKVKVLASETEEMVREVPVNTDGVYETKAKNKAKVMETGMNIKKEETEVKLKRKKEKRKTEGFENELEGTEDKKIIPKKKNKLIKEETVAEEETEVKIKKKKKSKKAKEEDEKAEAEEMEPKKKKKKVKEREGIEDRWDEKPKINPPAESQSKKSKKKKNSVKEDQDINTAKAGGEKKKIIKQEQKNSEDLPQVDVVFLSAKTGNTDEVSINQERRKNLQMEIDEESQPQKSITLGQWSTARFDNSQQQHKFLRLMGGFKRGSQPAGATAGGANMALGKDAQQHLQQGLLGEFERAHARRMDFSNRGAGLGFSAPSNKKFSIDINTSRSIRFDD